MINFTELFNKFKLPFLTNTYLCFDLGTSKTKVGIKDKGVTISEPTYLGYNLRSKEYIFFGKEAKSIVGKTPDFIKIIRPVVSGVISNFDAEVELLKTFINQSVNIYFQKNIIKPVYQAISIIPPIATEIEKKAVEEALNKIGISNTFIIEKPLATASGCGINIFSHTPNLIVDMGGGLIEISIVSGGGIVSHKTLKSAGDHMNKLIYNYCYLKYGLILGESTCESLKIDLLNFVDKEEILTIRGKSLENGLPKSVRIKSSDVKEALLSTFNQISDGIKELIESSQPEILDELLNKGIIITGGLAQIKGIDTFFTKEIKIDVNIAQNPQHSTINGLLKLSESINTVEKIALR
jgi:rod shape-determining protein MreB and related proteins